MDVVGDNGTGANPPAPADGTPWAAALRSARDRAREIEEARRLPADLAAELAAAGVFRRWIPAAYGGHEVDLATGLATIEEAAHHDGATGWCVMIALTTSLMAGSLEADHAAAIFGPDEAVAGGQGAPVGLATVVDGGLRVSGRWSWGSGSSHCTWFGGGARVVDARGAPARTAEGAGAVFVFVPIIEVTLLDTWFAAGLRGTASTDYELHDVFVPEGRWMPLDVGARRIDSPLYRFSTFGALALGVAAVTLGLGRRAIDELAVVGDRRPVGSSRSLAERPTVQAELARAEAAVGAAGSFVGDVVAEASAQTAADGRVSPDNRRRLRLAACHAAEASSEAVGRCYHAAGAAAVYEDSPLQRVFRDVNVATQHAMVAPRMLEPLGRMRFGLETDIRSL